MNFALETSTMLNRNMNKKNTNMNLLVRARCRNTFQLYTNM